MNDDKDSILSILKGKFWRERVYNTLLITASAIIGFYASTTYPTPGAYIILAIISLCYFSYMALLYFDVKRFGMRLINAERRRPYVRQYDYRTGR